MPKFFAKNTLSKEETVWIISIFALLQIKQKSAFGKYFTQSEVTQVWKMIYNHNFVRGNCSIWHANKIEMSGKHIAKHYLSADLLTTVYALFDGTFLNQSGTQIDIEKLRYFLDSGNVFEEYALKTMEANNIDWCE